MFKARHEQSKEDIVILDPNWVSQLDRLRRLDKQDRLVCPGCEQPVRVKAGQKIRWHFAHKNLEDCPLSHEAPVVLEARAVLYQWLVGKFQAGVVTLEKELAPERLLRPVDCWVETKAGEVAYWIIASQIKPAQRETLQQVFDEAGVRVNWLFLMEMLREEPGHAGNIYLTTTEREFMAASDYNKFIDRSGNLRLGGTLHYLDPTQELLATFRSLRVVHSPQLYGGRKQVHPMSEVLVHPKTGEFVHPGEFESWQRIRKRWERIEKAQEEAERRGRAQLERFDAGDGVAVEAGGEEMVRREDSRVDQGEGICILCGQVTTEWGFITELGKRICRDCYEGGSR